MPINNEGIFYPVRPVTGRIVGTVTGTLYPFGALDIDEIYLVASPTNSGTVWLVSNPGAYGFPLTTQKNGGTVLHLVDVNNTAFLQCWSEIPNDTICYIAVVPQGTVEEKAPILP